MGSTRKTPEVLDAMVEHVRYEVLRTIEFAQVGNGWCGLLNPDLDHFASTSILESGLLHFRCIVEFLGDQPKGDRVMARDYLDGWEWTTSEELDRVWELHGRLAHLGTVRRSVATDGDFSWQSWLEAETPAVFRGLADFLQRLQTSSPSRYQLFVQPRDDIPADDLIARLDFLARR